MRSASAGLRGLPRISLSTTTTVSAPSTKSVGCCLKMAQAFSRARRSANDAGGLTVERNLGNVGGLHSNGDPGSAQQFLATGRGGSQDQTHGAEFLYGKREDVGRICRKSRVYVPKSC